MKEAGFPRYMVYVGAAQGAALWFLWNFTQESGIPVAQSCLASALLWIFCWIPVAVYFTENTGLNWTRRAAFLAVLAVLCAWSGAYAAWVWPPSGATGDGVSALELFRGTVHTVASLTMGFMLLSLVVGWQPERRRFDYAALFVVCWRNALLYISCFFVVGLFWCVLLAGAMLMKSIGIPQLLQVMTTSVFVYPATCAAAGAAFAIGHMRAELLISLRRFCLGLNAWLLPLLLAFSVVWVAILPFAGLEPFFATRHAALILLWFLALGVFFLNCAWQDGMDAPVYPRWLASTLAVAWPSMVVVAGVAGLALWLRIRQHGLSEERVWAVFVWLLASGYAVGYSLSLLHRGGGNRWMHAVGRTNVAVAVFAVAGLFLLTTPLLDPTRLAVENQVARLEAGQLTPEAFDFSFLRYQTGVWGTRALHRLATESGDPKRRQLADKALAQTGFERHAGKTAQGAPVARVPAGFALESVATPGVQPPALPESLKVWVGRNEPMMQCGKSALGCKVWLRDINQDGALDALVIPVGRGPRTSTFLLTSSGNGWRLASIICCDISADELAIAIHDGSIKTVHSRWPDLMVNRSRISIDDVQGPQD